MYIQSITPTENFKYNNRSFKATFVNNKLFHKLYPANADLPVCYERFALIADIFMKKNEGHIFEITDIMPDKIKVRNISNGIEKIYSSISTGYHGCTRVTRHGLNYDLTYLMMNILDDKEMFKIPSASKVEKQKSTKNASIFLNDDKGIWAVLSKSVENNQELSKLLDDIYKQHNGHQLEIIDSKDFCYNGLPVRSTYTVLNYKTAKKSNYELNYQTQGKEITCEDRLRELLYNISKDKYLFRTSNSSTRRFMKLTGQTK